jgi:hypothetical protein
MSSLRMLVEATKASTERVARCLAVGPPARGPAPVVFFSSQAPASTRKAKIKQNGTGLRGMTEQ